MLLWALAPSQLDMAMEILKATDRQRASGSALPGKLTWQYDAVYYSNPLKDAAVLEIWKWRTHHRTTILDILFYLVGGYLYISYSHTHIYIYGWSGELVASSGLCQITTSFMMNASDLRPLLLISIGRGCGDPWTMVNRGIYIYRYMYINAYSVHVM